MRILEKYKDKDINIIMVGSGGATPGKLVAVTDQGFTMETRWSNKHHFNLAQLQSFWCVDDKPAE